MDAGIPMFDKKKKKKKTLIVEPWSPNMDIRKADVEIVPIWVKFPALDIKYWGQASLSKIAGIIGK